MQLCLFALRKKRKDYKRILNKKKAQFRVKIFEQIDQIEQDDPKKFWDLYNDLSESSKSMENPTSPSEWWNHFNYLINRSQRHRNEQFQKYVDHFCTNNKDKTFCELDFTISDSEKRNTIKKLKIEKGRITLTKEMMEFHVRCLKQAKTH